MFSESNLLLYVSTFVAWTAGVGIATWIICKRYMGSSADASEDYFAGGRALKWYVISGSLMLTNLSTEQLVGLNGQVFKDGCLAGIWWEAGAAIAMIFTATFFLPRYIALGLTTTTGFLGERYDRALRTLVAVIFLLYYALVLCPVVLYTGALAIRNIFDLDAVPLWVVSTLIGLLGAAYALVGGLKAVAVSDCLNGLGLIFVGFWVPIAALRLLPGGFSAIFEEPSYLKPLVAESQIYDNALMGRESGAPSVPWHVVFTGLTVTNMYYWSTNQVIVQRVLAAESLAQGQKGVLFAACMKVVGFSFLCLPGILGLVMMEKGVEINGKVFHVDTPDEVYPELVKAVMPTWSLGFFAAVLLGSVLSTFNSALNSASTMFGLELYKIYLRPAASDDQIVSVATVFGASLALLSFLLAPQLEHVESIFKFLQQMNSIVSLPIVTVFFVGIATALPDAFAAKFGFFVAVLACGAGQFLSNMHYLHRFFISFLLAAGAMALATYVPCFRRCCRCDPQPKGYIEAGDKALVDLSPWKSLPYVAGAVVLLLALLIASLQSASPGLFYAFWCLWAVALVGLMAASSRPRSGRRDEVQEQQDPAGTKVTEQTLPRIMGNTMPVVGTELKCEVEQP